MTDTPEDGGTDETDTGPRLVSAVETACGIVDELHRMGPSRVSDLADAVDRSKGTVYTHLATLKAYDLVTKTGSRYELSLRFWHIGQRVYANSPLLPAAVPDVRRLAQEVGAEVHLVVEQNGWGSVLHLEPGPEASRTPFTRGKQYHLHYLAGGKALLAALPPHRVDEIVSARGLPEQTDNTITDREALARELDTVRDQGFARDKQEFYTRLRGIGVAVLDSQDRPVGAVVVAGPVGRLRGERFERELPETLLDAATSIELQVELSKSHD